jgi:hypothetical protein
MARNACKLQIRERAMVDKPTGISLTAAREHVRRGEQSLAYAKLNEGVAPERDAQGARIAVAHFAAATAITGILMAESMAGDL